MGEVTANNAVFVGVGPTSQQVAWILEFLSFVGWLGPAEVAVTLAVLRV